jgi:threonine synthase
MDILISSNLERLVYELCGRNANLTAERMSELKKSGKYQISKEEIEFLDSRFYADYCDKEDCMQTIADVFDEFGYVLDTHTAVAMNVKNSYSDYSNDKTPAVVLSTASPYKFAYDVLRSITDKAPTDAFKAAKKLNEETAAPIPEQILSLKDKTIRFSSVIEPKNTVDAVMAFAVK